MKQDHFDLTDRRILVTGAAGHIGLVLARSLIDAGARVIAVDREPLPPGLAAECERAIQVDLADADALQARLDELVALGSSIHGIVHAAAYVGTSSLAGWLGDLGQQSRSTFDQAMAVNLGSAFTLVKALQPVLTRASLVFISSIYAEHGPDMALYEGTAMDNPAAYGVSKAGLQQLSRYMAARYGKDGLRSNSIVLGGVYREQDARFVARYNERTSLKRMAVENDLIGPVIFLLSDASAYITGTELTVDGGYSVI